MSSPFLYMKNISKQFPGIKALDRVSLAVDKGEIVALLGENGAGKSTLMNVLGGVVKKDEGEIFINGVEVNLKNAKDSQRNKIEFIHQDLSLFKQLTVAENIFIEKFPKTKSKLFISKKQIKQKTKKIMDYFEVDIHPNTKVMYLPISKKQIVEIASAISKDAQILIFDEPASSLTTNEREKLYRIVRQLKSDNKCVIYITHDIDAALELNDKVYVLKDGKNVGELLGKNAKKEEIIKMMIGGKIQKEFRKSKRQIQEEYILEVRNISTIDKLDNVSVNLRKGEILGMYGLVGSGRTELIRAMFGLDPITTGSVVVKKQEIRKLSPKSMKEAGIGYLTENRRDEGLFLDLSIKDNITMTDIKKISKGALELILKNKDEIIASSIAKKLDIRAASLTQNAADLSGGNQQKVVIGKWLHLEPDIFIFDEPTKGIDVGAKNEIYKLIEQLACNGISIIFISSEIEEVIGISDRVVVMCNGRIVAEFKEEEISQEKIIIKSIG